MADTKDPLDAYEQEALTANLQEESLKFIAERRKLSAEADKLISERRLLPWTLLVALASGVGLGVVQIIAKHWGLLP